MLALLALSRSGEPIRQKLDQSVSTGDVVDVVFIVVDGFISVGSGGGLDDVFAFDLEEDVVGCKWSHGLFDVSGCCRSGRVGDWWHWWDWCVGGFLRGVSRFLGAKDGHRHAMGGSNRIHRDDIIFE